MKNRSVSSEEEEMKRYEDQYREKEEESVISKHSLDENERTWMLFHGI